MSHTLAIRRLFLLLALLTAPFMLATPAQARYAALVVDAGSGRVLYARDAHQSRYPASLTKMMTLYLVFEALERGTLTLNQRLPVSNRAAAQPPSKLGLRVGDSLTVRQAILALVTRSANDVATVVAEALGRTEPNFARMMTKKARALGMARTTFRNASGLPDERQVTTAWDMLNMALALQRDFPQYYHYFSVTDFAFRGATHRNHNGLLFDYAGVDGIKTGYIRASGFNLVASVRRAGRSIIGIVFGGDSAAARNAHMRDLLDQGFERLQAQVPRHERIYSEAGSPVPIAEPATVEQGSADAQPDVQVNKPSWAVQVGAFSRLADAEKQASTAIQAIPNLLLPAQKSIDRRVKGGRTLYYTRFKHLSRVEAKAACQALQERRIDCFTLFRDGSS